MKLNKFEIEPYNKLVFRISSLLVDAKNNIAKTVNNTMIITNWYIGQYIIEYEQKGQQRAEYGKQLLKHLSDDLTKEFGRGYSQRSLRQIRQFYIVFQNWQTVFANSDAEKWQTLSAKNSQTNIQTNKIEPNSKILTSIPKLSWSHLVRLLSVKDSSERNFYIIESAENKWSERELNRQINTSLFERLALSSDKKKVKELSKKGQLIKTERDLLKDPLVLEFLNIKENNSYSENELETAIIENLGTFLLELGKGFSFVSRQKRITSGTEHFYIDLVFYNRLLQCFVIIDLKIGKLMHKDIGQMQMYVNYYDREIKNENENPTIGIILCKEKDDFVIEYTLPKNNKQIFANEYKLYLPNKKQLQKLLEQYI